MKKVLVTGANGFIGRYMSKRLADRGYYVIGIGHGFWTESEMKEWGISEWYEVDITMPGLVAHAGKPHAIFHFAGSGSVGFSVENPFQDFERTVVTTLTVLEFIRTLSPETILVYPSSAAVYGIAEKQPINENDALHPVSPYGYHKKLAEELCFSYGKNFGIRSALIRLFSVYGPELRKQLLWDSCVKLKKGVNEFFGSGNETRDWVHVKDVVRLMETAMLHATNDGFIINGGTGISVTIAETIRWLEKPEGNPRFNGKVKTGDPQHYQADISVASSIGWKPEISWKAGIDEYVAWFKSLV